MQVDISTILLLLVAVLYLIMLPGYLVILVLRVHGLDIVEIFTAAFGVGVCVLAALSIILSIAGSIGLTFSSLMIANTMFLVVVGLVLYLRSRPKRDDHPTRDNTPQA